MRHVSIQKNAGFGMIEILVTLVILLTGLLGLAGLLTVGQQAEMESYQRAQALILLQDMVDRINANRKVATCYAITTNATTGTPYMGKGTSVTPTCAASTTAVADLNEWNNALIGAAESSGGTCNTVTGLNCVGAMIGARGCIQLLDATTNTYMVSVAWQGLSPTFAPVSGLNCASTLYGTNEKQRRVVSATLRIGDLAHS